ncbi:hypothetical protein L3X38_035779 [Prunus dulcis]|uniref:Uncharacterized protein n=1 Tax=Prunus dulcis TaxID=3755 RepID=A0AAD4VKB5_PRUDU|nr:hypothetical protein L3X38_035779 [Prunus dulcis]
MVVFGPGLLIGKLELRKSKSEETQPGNTQRDLRWGTESGTESGHVLCSCAFKANNTVGTRRRRIIRSRLLDPLNLEPTTDKQPEATTESLASLETQSIFCFPRFEAVS